MKICYLSDAPTVHTHRWARAFLERGHSVTVISFRPYDIPGVDVIDVGGQKPLSLKNYLDQAPKISKIIKSLKPDVLHAHYCTSYGFVGAISGFHPYIVSAWGSDVLVSPEDSMFYRMLVKWVFSKADLITSMADHMTRHMITRKYASPEKILTVPFGVDVNEFNPLIRASTTSHDIPIVLSTRRLDRICDIQTFIRSIPIVLERISPVKFLIASDGPLRTELELLVDKLNITENVEFIGWVPQKDLPLLLSTADIAISTAISDGNNVSLNEAMACGAFPIATDIPANREWVIHGENGLLFSPKVPDSLAKNIILALEKFELRNSARKINWDIIQQRASWKIQVDIMEARYYYLSQRSGNHE